MAQHRHIQSKLPFFSITSHCQWPVSHRRTIILLFTHTSKSWTESAEWLTNYKLGHKSSFVARVRAVQLLLACCPVKEKRIWMSRKDLFFFFTGGFIFCFLICSKSIIISQVYEPTIILGDCCWSQLFQWRKKKKEKKKEVANILQDVWHREAVLQFGHNWWSIYH